MLLARQTGQSIAADRSWRIETALRPVLAEHDAPTIDALVARLLAAPNARLGDRIVDALLNQETSFFRDATLFDAAIEAVTTKTAGARPRIWCAGCATGQEPLSLAMAFSERGAAMPDIVATDVSEGALLRARSGRYSQFEIQRGLAIRRLMNWFTDDREDWVAAPALLRQIVFRRHNLVADAAPGGPFDIVLCRNVLFYLKPALQRVALDTIAASLAPGGLLMLGAGETVIGRTDRFVPSTTYRGLYESVAADPPASPI